VTQPVKQWLPPQAIGNVTYIVMAIVPHLPPDRLLPLVRYGVWVILLDDRLDDPQTSPGQLQEVVHLVQEATGQPLRNGADTPNRDSSSSPIVDHLRSELAQLVEILRESDPAGAAVARFGEAIRDAVAASVELTRLQRLVETGQSPSPSMRQYLALAAEDINYRSWAWALAIQVATPPTRDLDVLDFALEPACIAARLANDIPSAGRDRRDRRLNILQLLTPDGAPVTETLIRQHIAALVRQHGALLDRVPGLSAGSAKALADSLLTTVRLYDRADLR
jgi:hypothetical protein